MQTMGVSFDGEWESICKLFSVEDQDTNISHNNLFDYTPSNFSYETNYPPNNYGFLPNYSSSQEATHNIIMPSINDFPGANDLSLCMDFSNSENDGNSLAFLFLENMMSNEPNVSSGDGTSTTQLVIDNVVDDSKSSNLSSPNTELTLKRKPRDDEKSGSFTTPKKKARVSRNAQKGKVKVQPKKDEETMPTMDAKEEQTGMQSMDCDNSEEEESNATEEINETAESESSKSVSVTTSTGKKRASRGAATDPQSLYARRRRMRINERLKILQSLVPNGTKVDISTMLEEAFHYVKFLQLQIRLLSSDELWMFAPLAYNGLDVGAYKRLSPFLG